MTYADGRAVELADGGGQWHWLLLVNFYWPYYLLYLQIVISYHGVAMRPENNKILLASWCILLLLLNLAHNYDKWIYLSVTCGQMQMVSIYSLDIADMHASSPRTIALPSLSTAGSATSGGTFNIPQSVSVVCKLDVDIK